jgi:hypothetical protein
MNLDERWACWIQASIAVGAVDRFFMPAIQGLRRLAREILHDDQRFNSLDQKARESVGESALGTAASLSFSKEVVGIHVLLIRSLFGAGIRRRLLQRVSLEKPTSAALQF